MPRRCGKCRVWSTSSQVVRSALPWVRSAGGLQSADTLHHFGPAGNGGEARRSGDNGVVILALNQVLGILDRQEAGNVMCTAIQRPSFCLVDNLEHVIRRICWTDVRGV